VEVAQRNCDRLIVLINDILDVRKMEAGEMTFDRKPQELLPLVERSIESNRGYAEKLGASLLLTQPLPGLMVDVDPVRIEQALTNLLSNAVKYGRDGDRIEVTMQRQGGFVRVSIVDHGEGVPLAFQRRIFQKFSQADSSSTRNVAGTGLGLCIVRMILESHRGRAGFESSAGRGSTFYIELPVQA
jgi:signal transduction histidine kinase